jgi:SAM-dependent methyltransferase
VLKEHCERLPIALMNNNFPENWRTLMWKCVLCAYQNSDHRKPSREKSNCMNCGSTWRARAVALNVLIQLGYPPQSYPEIKSDWSRVGLGISDDVAIASVIPTKFLYSNTYYDAFPSLDIRKIPKTALYGFEFVICSDVLEHIDVKLADAVKGVSRLLKPNGFAVLSVPVVKNSRRNEFYPKLSTFKIEGGKVFWEDTEGSFHIDRKPEFHGGRGQNLAFREFTEMGFEGLLLKNGFQTVSRGSTSAEFGVPDIKEQGIFIGRVV